MFDSQDKQQHHGAKSALEAAGGFGRRQQQAIQIRKSKRDGALEKKRRATNERGQGSVVENPSDPWSYSITTPPQAVPLSLLPQFVELVRSNDPASQYQGTLLIRKLLAVEVKAPNGEVIASGVVPDIANLISTSPDEKLQFEASWVLSNIASGPRENTELIVNLGVIPTWVNHLSSPSSDCREQATWALGNVAGEGPPSRDVVLQKGAMQPILNLITSSMDDLNLLKNGVWCLSNMCRFKPQPKIEYLIPAVPVVTGLLRHADLSVATDAAWTVSYISDGPQEYIKLVIRSGCVPIIIEMLASNERKLHMPAVRTIGNICAGPDDMTQVVVNLGALNYLGTLLNPTNQRNVRKEAAWTLSNITAGTREQIQAVINANIIPIIIASLNAVEIEVRREATWTLANLATNANTEQLDYVVECNALEALCQELMNTTDPSVLMVTLETVEMILSQALEVWPDVAENSYQMRVRAVEGDLAIENLQTFDNQEVRDLAQSILTANHFAKEDDDDDQGPLAGDAGMGNDMGGQFDIQEALMGGNSQGNWMNLQ